MVCVWKNQENDENIRIQPLFYAAMDLPSNLECSLLRNPLPVMKDCKAIQDVGKYPELGGLIVSVITRQLGTACISFEREYPEQRFAGFIARSQEA